MKGDSIRKYAYSIPFFIIGLCGINLAFTFHWYALSLTIAGFLFAISNYQHFAIKEIAELTSTEEKHGN